MSFLRTLFGPSKDEIWQQFSAAIGGSIVAGGYWKGSMVEAAHGQWIITLDTYTVSTGKSSVTYTRMRAPYVQPGWIHFLLFTGMVFLGDIGKVVWYAGCGSGVYPEFDDLGFHR